MDDGWAPPDSLLGQLQRGRGLGHQRALVTPGAGSLVHDCLARDPRWDRQTEERAEYYARLLSALGLPAREIDEEPGDPQLPPGPALDDPVDQARRGSPEVSDRTDDELLRLARTPRATRERTAAFRELSRRGDLVLLDLAEDPGLRNAAGVTSSLAAPLVDLGARALPRARRWLGGDDRWLRALGKDVVSAHGAGHGDAAQLLEWFDEAVLGGSWCETEAFADGLARLGHQAAVPSIARAWQDTPHSIARRHYLAALVTLDVSDLEDYLDEAVDDCESDVRAIAARVRGVGRALP